ncbi:MAG: B12-binding domain-containing radical SAM protein [Rhodospirillaceae bacterium]|nr:B12-binding domain-containing radical SAM protein [Rhodospirillaceae bacterium]MBT5039535.1 B12-binding domain-containing radical SAM protein [Rhodospirillaceae bacterium]MBT5677349.1 B12-binding domain-containing radical SAM protein [Rhodospirillaceae bacterium]
MARTRPTSFLSSLAMINVVMHGDYQYEAEIPLGVGAVAAYIRQKGFPVQIFQCLPDDRPEDIANAGLVDADVYGFQLQMSNYQSVRAVAEIIRQRKPRALIVLGGPYLSSLAVPILENEALFDCVVNGEGEATMLEIMEAVQRGDLDLAAVSGLVFRSPENKAIRTPPRKLIRELDSLPYPARDFIDQAQRDPDDHCITDNIRIITSRGCVANCSFCSVNFYTKLAHGKLWRGRSAERVVDELEMLTSRHKVRTVNFSDSSFEDPGKKGKQRTRDICNGIIERKIELSSKVYMRADTMLAAEDDDLLSLWKKAGIDMIIVGAESGSDLELTLYEKRADLADNLKTIGRLKEMDLFFIWCGMLMFGPNSTLATLRDNIHFLDIIGVSHDSFAMANVLMLMRDTALYGKMREQGRVTEPENYWELPKYSFLDPLAERAASHWENILARFPAIDRINKAYMQSENIITRMTNPMNAHILGAVGSSYDRFKADIRELEAEFGARQSRYFRDVLDNIETGISDADLNISAQGFFVQVAGFYAARFEAIYNAFYETLLATKLGLSGVVFRHYWSSVHDKAVKRLGTPGDSIESPENTGSSENTTADRPAARTATWTAAG